MATRSVVAFLDYPDTVLHALVALRLMLYKSMGKAARLRGTECGAPAQGRPLRNRRATGSWGCPTVLPACWSRPAAPTYIPNYTPYYTPNYLRP